MYDLKAQALLLIFLICITLMIIFVRDILVILTIYCGFSFSAMILYIFSGAPDVAFTEAVIGVISTLYFVISLKSTERKAKPFRSPGFVQGIFLGIMSFALMTLFVFVINDLPQIGDALSPASTHVSDYYITHAEDTDAPNMVTAILADFRGFDTMWETTVMFLSAAAVHVIIQSGRRKDDPQVSWGSHIYTHDKRFDGLELRIVMAVVIPVIMIFALYVLLHGEISLGGGFQAGALLATAYVLYCTFGDPEHMTIKFVTATTIVIAGCGVLLYALAGILPMFNGGMFFEYARLPFPAAHPEALHGYGILLIEIGVTFGVMGTIISIYNDILIRNEVTDLKKALKKDK